MHDLLRKLTGGDRRSIGRVDEVVADVWRTPLSLASFSTGWPAEIL
jgi:hypothetical protein